MGFLAFSTEVVGVALLLLPPQPRALLDMFSSKMVRRDIQPIIG